MLQGVLARNRDVERSQILFVEGIVAIPAAGDLLESLAAAIGLEPLVADTESRDETMDTFSCIVLTACCHAYRWNHTISYNPSSEKPKSICTWDIGPHSPEVFQV